MARWYINPSYSEDIQNVFANSDKVLSIKEGQLISASSISRVIKFTTHGINFYIKHYFTKGKRLRKFFGRPRFKAEWENLAFCKKLNILVPNVVAYGVKKNPFSLKAREGFIITEEVPNATDLVNLVNEYPHLLKNLAWRRRVMIIIAGYVRSMHAVNFIHYDLQWRNILVTRSFDCPQVYLFDIPSGRKRRYSFKNGVIRDFYNLYKTAHKFLSRTECLRFYLLYKNKTALNHEDKVHIKQILTYFARKEFEDSLKEPVL